MMWAIYFAEKLIEANFQWSYVDECVWCKYDHVFLCYVDDRIKISVKDSSIGTKIRQLQSKG